MEVFHYNQKDEIYGYSANQVFWTPSTSLADCKSVDTKQRCPTLPTRDNNCYQIEQCLNDQLRQVSNTSQSSNGRYIDSRNMQFTTVLHTFTMSAGIFAILAYGAREYFFPPPLPIK